MKKYFSYAVSMHCCAVFLFIAAFFISNIPAAYAGDKTVFRGKVFDVEGKAVEGAKVFVYRSADVRRSADFISAPTDKDGLFSIVLPQGRYWSVARLKRTEGFGPLMPGDKHSGEPIEMEVSSVEINMNFIVADLKEAIKAKNKNREGAVRISGRVVDEKGSPVTKAYVIANRIGSVASGFPDYLSAWVDEDGGYTIYVAPGKYSIGVATTFPPGRDYSMCSEMNLDADKTGVDIFLKSCNNK